MNTSVGRRSHRETQFDLRSLFEFVTCCAILSGLSGVLGIASSVCLMLMALALWARQGFLSLTMLMMAYFVANWKLDSQQPESLARAFLTILVAFAICLWFRARRLISVKSGLATHLPANDLP
jgi:uncharacterized membrane-anchored protein